MHVVYVSDGKAGHRSQALGLSQAIQQQSGQMVSFEEVSIKLLSRLHLLRARGRNRHRLLQQAPDYIIGVGSHTQIKVLLLAKVFPEAKTIILMKPNLPFKWFDYVIVPRHDGIREKDNIFVTQGALNPIVNEQRHQANRILIALGGDSKRHQWHSGKVLAAIQNIVLHNPEAEIILTTSRRTPTDFLTVLKQDSIAEHLQIFPVEKTPQGWIFTEMQKAEAVWVTEDSVSMIYEALTAGCRVGVIKVDRMKQDRITKSVDILLRKKMIADTADLDELPAELQLQEAARVAQKILI